MPESGKWIVKWSWRTVRPSECSWRTPVAVTTTLAVIVRYACARGRFRDPAALVYVSTFKPVVAGIPTVAPTQTTNTVTVTRDGSGPDEDCPIHGEQSGRVEP